MNLFQSPRSRKFISNVAQKYTFLNLVLFCFNPLDRGNLYQIRLSSISVDDARELLKFQSPRSGKFVSNVAQKYTFLNLVLFCFNPLDRGNLYQIRLSSISVDDARELLKFQSPRSGKFVSNSAWFSSMKNTGALRFNPLDRGN